MVIDNLAHYYFLQSVTACSCKCPRNAVPSGSVTFSVLNSPFCLFLQFRFFLCFDCGKKAATQDVPASSVFTGFSAFSNRSTRLLLRQNAQNQQAPRVYFLFVQRHKPDRRCFGPVLALVEHASMILELPLHVLILR